MRWDEIGWDNTAPATLMDIRAGIDAKGNIVGFDFTQFYPQYQSENVERVAELTGDPAPLVDAQRQYRRCPDVQHRQQPLPAEVDAPDQQLVQGGLDATGGQIATTFAVEQMVDDLAHVANMDPVAFRVQNINQGPSQSLAARGAHCRHPSCELATEGGRIKPVAANIVSGRGVAWSNIDATEASTKMAAIADVTVNKKTGKVTVEHVYQAFSSGLLVYPGGVSNQSDGGITQVLSRLLWEQLRYTKTNVTGLDWVTYPIMRFKESPKVS